MKNKVLFVFLITAFINVFVNFCFSIGVSNFTIIADQEFITNLHHGSLDDSRDLWKGDVIVGPILGINFTKFRNIDLPTNNYLKGFNTKNVNGMGYFVGLNYIFPFGSPYNSRSNLVFELFYNKNSFYFENIDNIDIPQHNNKILNIPAKYSTDFSYSSLNLSIDFNLNPFYRGIFCGFKIGTGVVIHNKSSQYLEITSTDKNIKFLDEQNIKFKDDNRTMIINDGKISDFNSFQLSFSPLVGYDLLFRRMFIRITGGYDFSLTPLKKNSDWNYGNIFIGFGCIFAWL
jgi:hypothetical protein